MKCFFQIFLVGSCIHVLQAFESGCIIFDTKRSGWKDDLCFFFLGEGVVCYRVNVVLLNTGMYGYR